jgi:hypothetical protein
MKSLSKVARSPRNALSQPMSIRLLPEEVEKAQRFAREDMRSRAAFIRITFLRGLQAYELEKLRSA